MKKRSLSFFLAVLMVVSVLPLSTWAAETVNDDGTSLLAESDVLADAIYLPVTVRDFKSDGILFEYNNNNNSAASADSIATNYKPAITPSTGNQLEKGSNSANRGFGQAYVTRRLNRISTSNMSVTYNADGSMSFRASNGDPQIRFKHEAFKYNPGGSSYTPAGGTEQKVYQRTSYSHLAMVYKKASASLVNSNSYQIFWNEHTSNSSSGTYGTLTANTDDWQVVFIDINKDKKMTVNQTINADTFRLDWTSVSGAEITVAGFYFVNPPAQFDKTALTVGSTSYDIFTENVDRTNPASYFGVDSNGMLYARITASNANPFGITVGTNDEDRSQKTTKNGDANGVVAIRYKTTAELYTGIVRGEYGFGSLYKAQDFGDNGKLINDGNWHWFLGRLGTYGVNTDINGLGLYFRGGKAGDTIDIAEVMLLTPTEIDTFRAYERVSGNGSIELANANTPSSGDTRTEGFVTVTTSNGTTDTVVTKTECQDVLARPFFEGSKTINGEYTKYIAQKANAVVNLYDYTYVENASSSRLDFGANGKTIRYVQIRYRASNFPATNSSGTYIQNKLTFQFYTVSGDSATPPINGQAERSVRIDADGTWHTLVIDLGTNLEWFLFDIYTKLPNGAVLDVDYITFFHTDVTANSIKSSGILGAEYWNVNRGKSSDPPGDYINKYTDGYNFVHEALTMVQFTAVNGTVPTSVIDGRAYDYIWSDIAASKGTNAARIQAELGNAEVRIPYLVDGGSYNMYQGAFNPGGHTGIPNGAVYEAGGWRTGLVQPELVNGKIRYKEVTVRYIARVLSLALMIPYENPDGSRNYSALAGDKIDMADLQYYDLSVTNGDTCFDLAQYLRYKIRRYDDSTTDAFIVGAYSDTEKKVKDEGDITLKNIRTCTDAAYYLLNNMWNSYEDNGYGRNTYQYSNIGLIPFKTSNGVDAYMFGSSYTNTVYSDIQKKGLGIIYNTQTKTDVLMAINPDPNNVTSTTSANRFLTNFISGYGATHSPYYISLGNLANNKNDYYTFTTKDAAGKQFKNWYKVSDWNTLAGSATNTKGDAHFYDEFYKSDVNYNSTIEGKGQFTYKKSENLFFTFLGDDDVYLFINNKLALDLGGAHVRSGYTINLNSMVEDLGLVDGETYDFSFFQAERHGFGSNFQILTNIKIVNPDIEVEKTASQSGKNLEYGAQVSETEPVDYNFMLENTKKSDKSLVRLSFDDPAIGIHLGYDTLTLNNYTDINNITVKTYDAILNSEGEPTGNYNVYTYQANPGDPGVLDLDEAILKEILTGKLFPNQDADADDYGMSYGDKIEIIGIKHVLTEAQVQQGAFRNTVTVVANVVTPVGTYEPLVKNDTFLVIVANDKIYLWAGHERSFTLNQLFADGEYLGTYPFSYYSDGDGTVTIDGKKYTFAATAEYIANSATDTGATVKLSGSTVSTYKFTVSFPNVGMYMFDYNITTTVKDSGGTVKENTTYKYSVAVYVYDVEDVHFEIDYGLPVALSTSGDGKIVGNVCADDTLALDENGSTTWKTFGYCDSAGTVYNGLNARSGSNDQGDFSAISGDAAIGYNFTYTPNKFIEKADEVYLKFGVSEDHSSTDPKPYTVTKGIVMWKKISMRPASVMYYEEYIDSIKTNDTYGVTYYGTLNDGKPVATHNQYADQSLQYGYDPAYNGELKTTNAAIPAEYYSKWFKKLYTLKGTGTGGFDGKGNNYAFSNNSVLFLNVGGDKDDVNSYYYSYYGKEGTARHAVNFTFSGTGFELISYTNLYTASFIAEVYDSSDKLVQRKAVMTKYTNGQLHQIPVIDFETSTYGTYTVYVYAVPSPSGASPLFYLDGIRIFNPMDPSTSSPNAEVGDYLATERYASFNEIRNNILDDKIIISKVEVDAKGNVIAKAGTNSALVEHVGKGLEGLYDAPVGTRSDESALTYASVGPNNEIYLNKNSAITFLLKEATLTSNNAYPASRTFQIEAKMLGEKSPGTLLTYAKTDGIAAAHVLSYTAMYFPISVTECPKVTVNGSTYYVVTIGCADDAENNYVDGVISLTSFKMNGYELCTNLSTLITTEETANAATTEVTRTVYENMIDISAYALAYNGDLFVKTVTASPSAIAGETIKLNIVASANADRVFVKDASGEFVESTVQSVKTLGEYKIFTVTVNAPEEAGTYQYAVTVQDGDNRLSEEMRTAAIKVN